MVTATKDTVTHPNCDAAEAAGVILANVAGATLDRTLTALTEAEAAGSYPLGRAVVTCTGYQRNASHFDASTGLYRITLGRLV